MYTNAQSLAIGIYWSLVFIGIYYFRALALLAIVRDTDFELQQIDAGELFEESKYQP